MVSQDISRRALSTGVACEQDDASAAKRRNKEGAATVPCYRTIPYCVATGFLTSSSVHSSLSCERQGLANAKSLRTPSPCEPYGARSKQSGNPVNMVTAIKRLLIRSKAQRAVFKRLRN